MQMQTRRTIFSLAESQNKREFPLKSERKERLDTLSPTGTFVPRTDGRTDAFTGAQGLLPHREGGGREGGGVSALTRARQARRSRGARSRAPCPRLGCERSSSRVPLRDLRSSSPQSSPRRSRRDETAIEERGGAKRSKEEKGGGEQHKSGTKEEPRSIPR